MTARLLNALAAGFIFGLGLVISGMSNPAKVIGFLNVAGAWDPTLLLVMGGALSVTIPGFWLLKNRARPLFAERFEIPARKDLDFRLFAGAGLFGMGWGIAGFCPGPAITALATARLDVVLFVAAMIAGATAHKILFSPPSPGA
ncbi:MAG TPA: DUF6691 family protein [Gammaproteobacteria bacterium]|nr:DUF6691 family protein [Gammaproteobacteria bacterium]